jgi:hypothetical protein
MGAKKKGMSTYRLTAQARSNGPGPFEKKNRSWRPSVQSKEGREGGQLGHHRYVQNETHIRNGCVVEGSFLARRELALDRTCDVGGLGLLCMGKQMTTELLLRI